MTDYTVGYYDVIYSSGDLMESVIACLKHPSQKYFK